MDDKYRYKLEVRLHIVKEEAQTGGPNNQDIYWRPTYDNEKLSIEESVILGALDFMQLMGVLGQMHQAVRDIKPTP